MAERPSLPELAALRAIVTHRSFRRASDELELSPSSLSHMMRNLEKKLGVRLLHRTSRSVSPTEAGQRLCEDMSSVFLQLDAALARVEEFRGAPSGNLRLNASEPVARLLLARHIPLFASLYPDVSIDLVCEGRLVDIVADGFDAGFRFHEAVPQDMIAVPFGAAGRFVVVGSPQYFAAHGLPATPDDLMRHTCIRSRMPSGKLYRWEFERRGAPMIVDPPGNLTLDSVEMMVEAATSGLGLAYVPQIRLDTLLAEGCLKTVLDEWCPEFEGLCLYYSGRRHLPAALRAFIDVLKQVG